MGFGLEWFGWSLLAQVVVNGVAALLGLAGVDVGTMQPPSTPPAIEQCAEGTAYDPVSMACEPDTIDPRGPKR